MAAVNGKDAAATPEPAQQGQVSAAVAAFKAMEGKETMKLENVSMAFALFRAFDTIESWLTRHCIWIGMTQTAKRDFLIDLEKKYQKEWEEVRLVFFV